MSISTRASWRSEPTDVLLIEADGKELLAEYGVAVPEAMVATGAAIADRPGDGPWMVSAGAGGRTQQGRPEVVRCDTSQDVAATVQRMLGTRIKGHQVDACLIEQAVEGEERYLAVMVDAAKLWVPRSLLRSGRRHYRTVRFGAGAAMRAACRCGGRGTRRTDGRRARGVARPYCRRSLADWRIC